MNFWDDARDVRYFVVHRWYGVVAERHEDQRPQEVVAPQFSEGPFLH